MMVDDRPAHAGSQRSPRRRTILVLVIAFAIVGALLSWQWLTVDLSRHGLDPDLGTRLWLVAITFFGPLNILVFWGNFGFDFLPILLFPLVGFAIALRWPENIFAKLVGIASVVIWLLAGAAIAGIGI
jgi:hypothetical protein